MQGADNSPQYIPSSSVVGALNLPKPNVVQEKSSIEIILQELQELESEGLAFFNTLRDSYTTPYARIEAQRKVEAILEKLQKLESSCQSCMISNLSPQPPDVNITSLLEKTKKESTSTKLREQRDRILEKSKIVEKKLFFS